MERLSIQDLDAYEQMRKQEEQAFYWHQLQMIAAAEEDHDAGKILDQDTRIASRASVAPTTVLIDPSTARPATAAGDNTPLRPTSHSLSPHPVSPNNRPPSSMRPLSPSSGLSARPYTSMTFTPEAKRQSKFRQMLSKLFSKSQKQPKRQRPESMSFAAPPPFPSSQRYHASHSATNLNPYQTNSYQQTQRPYSRESPPVTGFSPRPSSPLSPSSNGYMGHLNPVRPVSSRSQLANVLEERRNTAIVTPSPMPKEGVEELQDETQPEIPRPRSGHLSLNSSSNKLHPPEHTSHPASISSLASHQQKPLPNLPTDADRPASPLSVSRKHASRHAVASGLSPAGSLRQASKRKTLTEERYPDRHPSLPSNQDSPAVASSSNVDIDKPAIMQASQQIPHEERRGSPVSISLPKNPKNNFRQMILKMFNLQPREDGQYQEKQPEIPTYNDFSTRPISMPMQSQPPVTMGGRPFVLQKSGVRQTSNRSSMTSFIPGSYGRTYHPNPSAPYLTSFDNASVNGRKRDTRYKRSSFGGFSFVSSMGPTHGRQGSRGFSRGKVNEFVALRYPAPQLYGVANANGAWDHNPPQGQREMADIAGSNDHFDEDRLPSRLSPTVQTFQNAMMLEAERQAEEREQEQKAAEESGGIDAQSPDSDVDLEGRIASLSPSPVNKRHSLSHSLSLVAPDEETRPSRPSTMHGLGLGEFGMHEVDHEEEASPTFRQQVDESLRQIMTSAGT